MFNNVIIIKGFYINIILKVYFKQVRIQYLRLNCLFKYKLLKKSIIIKQLKY